MSTVFSKHYFDRASEACDRIDAKVIDDMVLELKSLKERSGRLFLIGVGGSAGNCSHAVNDFRKICELEAYAPTDNVSELTARTNDSGWNSVFVDWLKVSRLNKNDCIFVMSVGGGSKEKNISPNIVEALDHARKIGTSIIGIVGRDGGYTAKLSEKVCIIPIVDDGLVTPITEAFQALVWHCLVSDPRLQIHKTTWESAADS